MRHVCSWQHQSTSKKINDIKETPPGIYFCMAKISYGKENVHASTADTILSQLDKWDTKE